MACSAVTLHYKEVVVFLLPPSPHRLWQVGVTTQRPWAAVYSQSVGETFTGHRAITTPCNTMLSD